MAVFKAKEKSILIDPEYYKKYSEYYGKHFEPKTAKYLLGREMYALLTHEVYHAISHRNDKELGLSNIIGIGIYGVPINTMVNEAFTEVAASRVSKTTTLRSA